MLTPFAPRFAHRLLGVVCLSVASVTSAIADSSVRQHQREVFHRALDAVEHGRDWKFAALDLETYPLRPWLEQIELTRQLDKAKPEQIATFLTRWPGTLAARDLLGSYLQLLAQRQAWKEFRKLYTTSISSELDCLGLRARLATGEKLDYATDLQSIWESSRALPAACGPVWVWARDHAQLDATHIWQRIDAALTAGQASSITAIADWLPATERDDARRLASALSDPAGSLGKANGWPDDARHRRAVIAGLDRLVRRDTDAVGVLRVSLAKHFNFSKSELGAVDAALALYRASEFDAAALSRLTALPIEAQTDATREWRVRVALAASDWKAALAALDALSDAQKGDEEWRYYRARVLVKLNRRDKAAPMFAALAAEANFFGFLAADWIDADYSICPTQLVGDKPAEQRLLHGGLERAFEWRAVGMLPQARREWADAISDLDQTDRRLAADLAYREAWYDRAVFALNKGDDLQVYEQRFPLAREAQIRRESHSSGLDPAWTYAIIRAESAWVEDARSGANAMGLMQLLPDTAARVAKRENIAYSRSSDLYLPDTNIALGTRYLSQMAERYNGAPWLASAAYNAGPGRVEQWLAARGDLEPDFFIASIPYKETREYVARVLAFSVIYDWRMNGRALAVAARLPRNGQVYAAPDAKTPRKAVSCPNAAVASAAGAAGTPTSVAAPTN